jgi:hypothetical protein
MASEDILRDKAEEENDGNGGFLHVRLAFFLTFNRDSKYCS